MNKEHSKMTAQELLKQRTAQGAMRTAQVEVERTGLGYTGKGVSVATLVFVDGSRRSLASFEGDLDLSGLVGLTGAEAMTRFSAMTGTTFHTSR